MFGEIPIHNNSVLDQVKKAMLDQVFRVGWLQLPAYDFLSYRSWQLKEQFCCFLET